VADCYSVVSEIKELMVFGQAANPGRVLGVATEYNALVQDAVRRLGECCDAVNKGQYAQAIFLADSTPVLLDLISVLDFDGAQSWNALARHFGAPSCAAFNAGSVQMLQDAYTHHEALEPLQKKYRRLAMKGGSVTEKLDVLRRVRKLDPSNPNWTQDIGALESVRIQEIAALLAEKSERMSEAEAVGMMKELSRSDLSIKPSETLLKTAKALSLKLKTKRVLAAMNSLVSRMNDAYAARDFQSANACLIELDALNQRDSVAFPVELQQPIQDARAWRTEQVAAAEKQAAYLQRLAELEGMVDAEAPPTDVKRFLRQFEYTDGTAPAGLFERAHSYVQRHELMEQRRRQGKLALIAAGVALVAGLAAWGALAIRDGRQTVAIAQEIRNATSTLNFASADQIVGKLKEDSPGKLNDFGIQQAVEELERARKDETTRLAQLNALTDQIDHVDLLSPKMDVLLGQAEKLVRTKPETDAVAEWKAKMEIVRREHSKDATEKASTLLAEADALLNPLKASDDPSAMKPLIAKMDDVLRKAELLKGLPREIEDQVKNYRTRLSNEEARATKLAAIKSENTEKLAKAHAALVAARTSITSDLKNYSGELMRKREEYAEVSPEFRHAGNWVDLVPAYVAALNWSEQAQSLVSKTPRAAADSLERYKDFREWLAAHSKQTENASPYQPLLQKYLARANFYTNSQKELTGLRALLKHDLMTKLYEFSVEDSAKGKTLYYTHDKGEQKNAGVDAFETEVFIDDTLTLEKKSFPRKGTGTIHESAHVTLAREISKLLEADIKTPAWSSSLPKAVRLVADASATDPYVRALLLNKLLPLDAQNFKTLSVSADLLKKVSGMCAEKISFWMPNDKVHGQLAAIAATLKEIQSELDGALKAFEAGREKMEIEGLYRPLILSAVAEAGADGTMNVLPIGGASAQKEYWTINAAEGGAFVFKIVAISGAEGGIRWIDGETVFAGQPLLSPKDGASTQDLARKFGSVASPFPSNLAAVQKLK